MDVKKRVNQIVRQFGTRNPLEIAESIGCIIVYYPLVGVRGFYHYFQRNHIIYVDERLPEHLALFVIAHELGHVFLHKNSNALFMDTRTHFVTNKYENEANLFAMDLLVSDEDIEAHLECTTSQLSRLLGYNRKLIELRLRDFN